MPINLFILLLLLFNNKNLIKLKKHINILNNTHKFKDQIENQFELTGDQQINFERN